MVDADRAAAKLLDVWVLRTALGILGMTFPAVLFVGALLIFGEGLQTSLSAYYWTGMRDCFVGFLWVIGILLFAYEGYNRRDAIAGHVACAAAVGVALFPTASDDRASGMVGIVHFACAAVLFGTLIYFSGFSFTKTSPGGTPTPQKVRRNGVYKACAWIMAGCMATIAVFKLFLDTPGSALVDLMPVFWLESIAIFAFGVSWFTKGETLLFRDA